MDDDQLRVSDDERQAVVDRLREHTTHGRLTLDEFADRTGEALAAVTRADLQQVLRDLPDMAPPAPEPTARRERPAVPWSTGLRIAAVVGIVALLASSPAFWWIVLPLFFWTGGFGLFGGCGGRRGRTEERGGWSACSSPPGRDRVRHTDDRQARQVTHV